MCESCILCEQCTVGSIKLYSNKNVECLLPVFMTLPFRLLLSALYHLFDLYCPSSSYIYLVALKVLWIVCAMFNVSYCIFGCFAPPLFYYFGYVGANIGDLSDDLCSHVKKTNFEISWNGKKPNIEHTFKSSVLNIALDPMSILRVFH